MTYKWIHLFPTGLFCHTHVNIALKTGWRDKSLFNLFLAQNFWLDLSDKCGSVGDNVGCQQQFAVPFEQNIQKNPPWGLNIIIRKLNTLVIMCAARVWHCSTIAFISMALASREVQGSKKLVYGRSKHSPSKYKVLIMCWMRKTEMSFMSCRCGIYTSSR